MFHIGAAQDVAFEFLQRIRTPGVYDAWTANRRLSSNRTTLGSQEACKKWKDENRYPLSDIREYRNHLTHGRMPPALNNPFTGKLYLPKIGKELDHLDWRLITDPVVVREVPEDFDAIDSILQHAFDETLNYFEAEWEKI